MTQENDTPVTTQEKDNTSANSDILLISLLELTEDTEEFSGKLGLTLFVQGTIVSGLLIGEKSYFEALSDELNNNISGTVEGKEAFKAFLAPFQTVSKKLTDNQVVEIKSDDNLEEGVKSKDNQEEKSQSPSIEFIHLQNAKFYNGGSLIPNDKGVYWRGILSRVDGFFIGSLTSDN